MRVAQSGGCALTQSQTSSLLCPRRVNSVEMHIRMHTYPKREIAISRSASGMASAVLTHCGKTENRKSKSTSNICPPRVNTVEI